MYKRRKLSTTVLAAMNTEENSEENTPGPSTVEGPGTSTYDIAKQPLNPINEANFRALRNIKGKITQCEHHIQLLSDHLLKGTAPRGLSSNIEPNVPGLDSILLVEWEKNKLEYQQNNLTILRSYWFRYRERLHSEGQLIEQHLKANTTIEEWQTMTTMLDKAIEATRKNYQSTQRTTRGRRNAGNSNQRRNMRNSRESNNNQ